MITKYLVVASVAAKDGCSFLPVAGDQRPVIAVPEQLADQCVSLRRRCQIPVYFLLLFSAAFISLCEHPQQVLCTIVGMYVLYSKASYRPFLLAMSFLEGCCCLLPWAVGSSTMCLRVSPSQTACSVSGASAECPGTRLMRKKHTYIRHIYKKCKNKCGSMVYIELYTSTVDSNSVCTLLEKVVAVAADIVIFLGKGYVGLKEHTLCIKYPTQHNSVWSELNCWNSRRRFETRVRTVNSSSCTVRTVSY